MHLRFPAGRLLAAALAFTFAPLKSAAAQTCSTITPPCPANEAPRIRISPTANVLNASSVVVTVTVADDAPMSGDAVFTPTLTGLASNSTGGGTSVTYTGTLSLSSGTTMLKVTIEDDD